ncbi:RecQ family ATP-dependent DNA helicase [Sporobolomyces salmoneus]|uniref:RecQ family ATP-dependent DNA helicase n=1 Tax=Sporobolomyces salmoneus TaxID=183962 RepID=UPI00316E30AD
MNKGKGKMVHCVTLEEEEDVNMNEATFEEQETLAALDEEITSLDNQIAKLNQLRANIATERDTLIALIQSRSNDNVVASTSNAGPAKKPQNAVDFTKNGFEWSTEAKQLAKDIWGIEDWRHCQEAAINASFTGRDAVVVMPTGGGKSLIYQVPALISSGCTVVITPLISLMTDQVQNLSERDIAAEAIHAATSQQDIKSIMKRMLGDAAAAKGKGKKQKLDLEAGGDDEGSDIKLVYVTPERIDKSKTFVSTLQKMYDAGRIARFVIDEAHCITTSGHDYRPAYLSLQKLKVLFPKVPVLAVTATAPSNVISDMIKTLGLPKRTSPGDAALPNSTVLFTAPLYRANLNWSVVPKPQKAEQAMSAIIDWILAHHQGETGIIYCLSRADSENVAKEINSNSKCKGKLKAAVYHAYIDDTEKLKVHERWRDKKIQVVCATNASFGLGIDNPSVRYVVHHTLAKSLANYYQEGGRAGRDGLPSDVVTFFRPADAARLSSLVHESWRSGAKDKLYEMLQFAQDYKTCRKVLFARYFASTYDDSKAFDDDEGEEPCESCDNCLRDASTIKTIDITTQAYRALRIISAAEAQDGTLTLPQAADLIRGNGGGSFSTRDKNAKVKGKVDVNQVAGSKVALNKEECEMLLLKLLIDGWLKEVFVNTAYATNSYLETSNKALRITRLSPSEFDNSGSPVKFELNVLNSAGEKTTKRKAAGTNDGAPKKKVKKGLGVASSKRRTITASSDDDDDEEEDGSLRGVGGEDDADDYPVYGEEENFSSRRNGAAASLSSDPVVDEDGWSTIVKNDTVPKGSKKKKQVEVLELD